MNYQTIFTLFIILFCWCDYSLYYGSHRANKIIKMVGRKKKAIMQGWKCYFWGISRKSIIINKFGRCAFNKPFVWTHNDFMQIMISYIKIFLLHHLSCLALTICFLITSTLVSLINQPVSLKSQFYKSSAVL